MKFIKIIKSNSNIEKALNDDYYAKRFLADGTIKKNDPSYDNVVRKAIEYNPKFAYYLLYSRKIKESSTLYNEVLEKVLEDIQLARNLLEDEIVTKYSPNYNKVLEKIKYS